MSTLLLEPHNGVLHITLNRPECRNAMSLAMVGELRATLQSLLDNKTKPLGSLGRIEQLALQLGLILQTTRPVLQAPQVLVCAGDHGLARRGVSAFPQDVTWQMVENFLAGGAAISVLAKQHGIEMPHDELLTKAEAFAIRAGGRSPRVARQFIELLSAGVRL